MGSESGLSYNMNVNGYYQYDGNAFDPKAISRNYSIRPFRLVAAVIAYNLLHFDSRTNWCVGVEIDSEKKQKFLCIRERINVKSQVVYSMNSAYELTLSYKSLDETVE